MNERQITHEPEDWRLDAALRRAGPRPRPSTVQMHDAYQVVHAEWRNLSLRRRRRRALAACIIPLGLSAVAIAAAMIVPNETVPTQDVSPTFSIDRQPLSQFLDWVARKTGRRIEYSSPQTRDRAEHLILRGSVGTLAPEDALSAVLATTPLTARISSSTIRIQLPQERP